LPKSARAVGASPQWTFTLEGLARRSAQMALLPGHRVAVQCCLEHVDEALDSHSDGDCNAILAALAIRLH
jgi:hypothetical protein